MNDVTRVLTRIEQGDSHAAEQLMPLVYKELRKLAAARLARESAGHSLQPTMLVHEAYVRLVDQKQPQDWTSRGHFFSAAAEAMRRILIEHARRRKAAKYGGGLRRVDMNSIDPPATEPHEDLLALNSALSRLEDRWPEKARLVKLRYFAGLTIPEASQAIGVSRATGERYWTFARAWLYSQMKNDS